jgi:Ca2+-binding RTX toxin-like protein
MAIVSGTSSADKLSGTAGNDMIQGFGGKDALYGSTGNDAFVIRLSDFDASLNSASSFGGRSQDLVYDFGGAGGWSATNNDFISLLGFGAGSTMSFAKYGSATDHTLQYYTIHSTTTGLDYTVFIHSLNGNLLSKATGDLNFYG